MAEDSFVVYTSYGEHLKKLPFEDVGKIFIGVIDYVENGKIPTLNSAADMCFSFIKSQIDRDKEKYENIKKKRAESGKKGGETKAKNMQKEAKQANAKSAITKQANLPDNVYVYDNDNDNVIKKEIHKEKNSSSTFVDFGECVGLFNSVCVSLPKAKAITETRKKAITTALTNLQGIEAYKDLSADKVFETFFETVERSDFLTGRNGNGWTASFDWVLKRANLVKIAEGNYDNRSETVASNAEDGERSFYNTAYYERLAAELEVERNGK